MKYLNLDTDSTMESNSDYKIASQKAIKTALSTKADISSIPTKVSELNNDSGYIQYSVRIIDHTASSS